MKKLLLFAATVCTILSSCTKEEEDSNKNSSSSKHIVKSFTEYPASGGYDTYDISYDNRGRVNSIKAIEFDENNVSTSNCVYNFSYNGDTMCIETDINDSYSYVRVKKAICNIQLNDKGYATQITKKILTDTGDVAEEEIYKITYNNDYLTSLVEEYKYSSGQTGKVTERYTWNENNNLAKIDTRYESGYQVIKHFKYSQELNTTNISINNIVAYNIGESSYGDINFLAYFGFLGKSSTNLVSEISRDQDENNLYMGVWAYYFNNNKSVSEVECLEKGYYADAITFEY